MQETGGTYTVALNEQHLGELALKHSPPPPSRPSDASASLVAPCTPPPLLKSLPSASLHMRAGSQQQQPCSSEHTA